MNNETERHPTRWTIALIKLQYHTIFLKEIFEI